MNKTRRAGRLLNTGRSQRASRFRHDMIAFDAATIVFFTAIAVLPAMLVTDAIKILPGILITSTYWRSTG